MAIFFDDTTSADNTMDAITEIRSITNKQCYLSSMSAVVTDIKALSEKETSMYVLIAVVLTSIVLALCTNCWILPVFFMISIGMAIVYNMGTNYFLGEISYITKALSAVLQLGVTMDYSIFCGTVIRKIRNVFQTTKTVRWPMPSPTLFFRFGKLCHYRNRLYRTLLHELHTRNGSWHRHGKRCCLRCPQLCDYSSFFYFGFLTNGLQKNFTPLPHS